MTIEQKIFLYLNKPGHRYIVKQKIGSLDIEKWTWFEEGEPVSISIGKGLNKNLLARLFSTQNHKNWKHVCTVISKVDRMIELANEAECLLSPSEYIRQCKKWFMENK